MYLKILVLDEVHTYLFILWKEEKESISIYQLSRTFFRFRPASYIATRYLHQLADDKHHRFPLVVPILKGDLYIDDLLTGADTLEKVLQPLADIM